MSYWVYVTLSCHNWKHLTFATAVPILFTSFVYRTNVYWSVIHGIKRKPHLSVVWNWYHSVAIAILHQPLPTDSADINTRLQLSDTSSIPPMQGGFLLSSLTWYSFMGVISWLGRDTSLQSLYSLSSKTSYHQILWSLVAVRLSVIIIVSLRNLPGISAALLPSCLSIFRAILEKFLPGSHVFETSWDLVVRCPSIGEQGPRWHAASWSLSVYSALPELIGI